MNNFQVFLDFPPKNLCKNMVNSKKKCYEILDMFMLGEKSIIHKCLKCFMLNLV